MAYVITAIHMVDESEGVDQNGALVYPNDFEVSLADHVEAMPPAKVIEALKQMDREDLGEIVDELNLYLTDLTPTQ